MKTAALFITCIKYLPKCEASHLEFECRSGNAVTQKCYIQNPMHFLRRSLQEACIKYTHWAKFNSQLVITKVRYIFDTIRALTTVFPTLVTFSIDSFTQCTGDMHYRCLDIDFGYLLATSCDIGRRMETRSRKTANKLSSMSNPIGHNTKYELSRGPSISTHIMR